MPDIKEIESQLNINDDLYITILLEIGWQFKDSISAKMAAKLIRDLFSTNLSELNEKLQGSGLEQIVEDDFFINVIKDSAGYLVVTDDVDEDLLRILDNRAGFHIRRVDEEFNCGKVRLYKADRILYNFETIWESVESAMNRKKETKRKYLSIIEEFYYVATMFDFHLKSRGKHNYLKILKERLPFVEKHHLSRLSIPTPRSTYSKKQRDECVKEVILNLGPKATVDEIISVASKILCERRVPHTINHVHHVCRVRRNLVDRRSIKQKILDVVKEEYIPYNKVITAKDVRHIAKKIDVDVDAVRKGLNGLIKSGDIPRELRLTQQELRNMNIEKAIKLMEDYIIENGRMICTLDMLHHAQ